MEALPNWQWDIRFWHRETHKQRVSVEQWKEALLSERDTVIIRGNFRQLIAKNLGYGVIEVSLQPLSEVPF